MFKPGGGGRDGMDARKLTHMIVDGGILSEIMWAEEVFCDESDLFWVYEFFLSVGCCEETKYSA